MLLPFRFFLALFPLLLVGEENTPSEPPQPPSQTETLRAKTPAISSIVPFTGKITKMRVRLRLEPHTESSIITELHPGQLFIIDGEAGDFYAVRPPEEMHAYIFRTFVLDDHVEGTKVNVRLTPSTESPIIAQLNTGDKIEGKPSTTNNKWLEIVPPPSFRLYISKEYVERAGDALYLNHFQERQKRAESLLAEAQNALEQEFRKPYPEINVEKTKADLTAISQEKQDFPHLAHKADLLLKEMDQKHLLNKISYLEEKARTAPQIIASDAPKTSSSQSNSSPKAAVTDKMAFWVPQENGLISAWIEENPSEDSQDAENRYYQSQKKQSQTLTGIVEPYGRNLKNRPGDFVLTNPDSGQILAFFYSTKVNLQDHVGKKASFLVADRPNNDFAFPAYFVIDVVSE